jgi:hypothetical protein
VPAPSLHLLNTRDVALFRSIFTLSWSLNYQPPLY